MGLRLKCYFIFVLLTVNVFLLLLGYHLFLTLNVCSCPKCMIATRKLNFTEAILENTRSMIKIETWNYNFTHSGVDRVQDLVMESGGTPVRVIIVSTWRSGSSFLGDLLNSIPGNFYNYEPFMIYSTRQVRKSSNKATTILKDMLYCNFTQARDGSQEYFAHVKLIKDVVNQIEHNRRLWSVCSLDEETCYDAAFVSSMCKLFPFQTTKLVRYGLSLVKPLLDETELNVKVVLLVRDPRAVMRSRQDFCLNECADPSLLCRDMVDDYTAAEQLMQQYPDKLTVLRFEDLVSDLNATTDQLLRFLRVQRAPSVDMFLQLHTTASDHRQFSTFRKSREVPYRWKTAMNFTHVENIQKSCREAMSKWGYKMAHNAAHMASKRFHPVRNLSSSLLTLPHPKINN